MPASPGTYSPIDYRIKRWIEKNGADRTPPASICSPARWRMFLANRERRTNRFSFAKWTKRTKDKWRCDCFTDDLKSAERRGTSGLY